MDRPCRRPMNHIKTTKTQQIVKKRGRSLYKTYIYNPQNLLYIIFTSPGS